MAREAPKCARGRPRANLLVYLVENENHRTCPQGGGAAGPVAFKACHQVRREEESAPGGGVKQPGFIFRMHVLLLLAIELCCIAALIYERPL